MADDGARARPSAYVLFLRRAVLCLNIPFAIISLCFLVLIAANITTELVLTSCIIGDNVSANLDDPECVDELQTLATWRELYLQVDLGFLCAFIVEIALALAVQGPRQFLCGKQHRRMDDREPSLRRLLTIRDSRNLEAEGVALRVFDAFAVLISFVVSVAVLSNFEEWTAVGGGRGSAAVAVRLLMVVRIFRLARVLSTFHQLAAARLQQRFRRRLRRVLREASPDQPPLEWRRSGKRVVLPPPAVEGGSHVFLSHSWRHAQDLAGRISDGLSALQCGCVSFLDVDNLRDITELEPAVDGSDLVLVILTAGYLSSVNCRRELLRAIERDKPLLVLLETDAAKGATDEVQLAAELRQLEMSGDISNPHREAANTLLHMLSHQDKSAAVPCVLHWYRERALRSISLRAIIAQLLNHREGCAIDDLGELDDSSEDAPELQPSSSGSASSSRLPRDAQARVSSGKPVVHAERGTADAQARPDTGGQLAAAQGRGSSPTLLGGGLLSGGERFGTRRKAPQQRRIVALSSLYREVPLRQSRGSGSDASVYSVLEARFARVGVTVVSAAPASLRWRPSPATILFLCPALLEPTLHAPLRQELLALLRQQRGRTKGCLVSSSKGSGCVSANLGQISARSRV